MVNREAFKTVLSQLWRTTRRVLFKEVQEKLWLFEFADENDKRRVLEGRPWSFDKQLIVINEFQGGVSPSLMDFRYSPFWIQVHDMPLLCMTKGVGAKIGQSLGKLEDVDVAGDGVGWGRSLTIRVTIDITQPLDRGRALILEGKSHWVSFQYEKLPTFCYRCGRIVHDHLGCPKRQQQRFSDTEERQWGPWLRAEGGKKKELMASEGGVHRNYGREDVEQDGGRGQEVSNGAELGSPKNSTGGNIQLKSGGPTIVESTNKVGAEKGLEYGLDVSTDHEVSGPKKKGFVSS
jgi:hypothetical protein